MRARWIRAGLILAAGGLGGGMPPASADDYDDARSHIQAAVAAFEQEDHATLLTEALAADALRSDHPTFAFYLAAAHALNGDAEATAEVLERIAGWGLYVRAEGSPHFAAVAPHAAVQRAFARLRANQVEQGDAAVAFEFPAEGGLWEGIAFEPSTNATFHSDLHHARIIRRAADGEITNFATIPMAGFGCGGMAIDGQHNLLWVSSPALPEVVGYTDDLAGKSRLFAFDLTTGELARQIALSGDEPRESTVVDVTVAAEGTVYAADSTSPVIWRVLAGSDTAEAWAEITSPGSRHSLQGTTLSADEAWLFVADYSTGLHAVAVATGEAHLLEWLEPATTSLLGIDGLFREQRALIATQNGVNPARLIKISLHYDDQGSRPRGIGHASTVAANLSGIDDPTLLTRDQAGILFIGNAGWSHFGQNPEPDSEHRMVPILRVPFRE